MERKKISLDCRSSVANLPEFLISSQLASEPSIKDAVPLEAAAHDGADVPERSLASSEAHEAGAGAEALPSGHARADMPDVVAHFGNVSFRFADASEDTLHHLNFYLRRGTTTAIIGQTGSGKSTIAKLMLRFHDVTDGELTVCGSDVRTVTQQELRDHISYVPQKAWLFSGTIADNLRDGKADASDEELWHALDVAQSGFVRELPDGLQSRVAQGGTNFSGGQRQRLSIARALVRPADLYIFDDSFSALDFKTDAALRHALQTEVADAAVLIIAQRINTILTADQIIVLKDGCIQGLGTHEELMRSCTALVWSIMLVASLSRVRNGISSCILPKWPMVGSSISPRIPAPLTVSLVASKSGRVNSSPTPSSFSPSLYTL